MWIQNFTIFVRAHKPDKKDVEAPLVAKFATTPTVTPKTIDAQGGMKPESGVAATRPEMAPEHYTSSAFLPLFLHNALIKPDHTHPTILHFRLNR